MRWWIISFILVLTVASVRVWERSESELQMGHGAEKVGDIAKAIEHFQYAARAYTPFGSAPSHAIAELARIGGLLEARGDNALALRTYRRMRGAILGTRSLYSPFGGRLETVNVRIANLMADEQLALGHATIAGRAREELVRDHLALLVEDPAPSTFWSFLVFVCFLGWVGGGLTTIFRGLNRQGEIHKPSFIKWFMFTISSFLVWLLALAQA